MKRVFALLEEAGVPAETVAGIGRQSDSTQQEPRWDFNQGLFGESAWQYCIEPHTRIYKHKSLSLQ